MEYTIKLTEEQIEMLRDGDYNDVEAVVEDILIQTGQYE